MRSVQRGGKTQKELRPLTAEALKVQKLLDSTPQRSKSLIAATGLNRSQVTNALNALSKRELAFRKDDGWVRT